MVYRITGIFSGQYNLAVDRLLTNPKPRNKYFAQDFALELHMFPPFSDSKLLS